MKTNKPTPKFLDPYKQDRGFRVPENYFETFETRLTSRIEARKKRPQKIVTTLRPWLTLAAIFILVALSYQTIPRLFQFATSKQNKSLQLAHEYEMDPLVFEYEEADLVNFIINYSENLELEPTSQFKNLSIEDIEQLIIF